MTVNAAVADAIEIPAVEANEEARALRGFILIVLASLLAKVVAFALFGFAGVGMCAIAEAGLMLLTCVFLTRG